MTKHWAKVIDDETKRCDVGLGTDVDFYRDMGYQYLDVEEAYDGMWYLLGYAPMKKLPTWAETRIIELKGLLAQYDYVGTKIATGCATIEDYKDIIEMCESYRQEIRELQKKVEEEDA